MSNYTIRSFDRIIAIICAVSLFILIWPHPVAAQDPTNANLDFTGNKVIDDADADMVGEAWAILQKNGQCLSPEWASRDVNGDGCIDVADVQTVLAHWGERTEPAPAGSPGDLGALSTATFWVNSTGDSSDNNKGDGVCSTGGTIFVNGLASPECTLRAALEESVNRPGPEIINFNVRNSNGSCPSQVTITPGNTLIIDDPTDSGITIDGYSQCGASPNTQTVGGNAVIKVQIQGRADIHGLSIKSANNLVKGLALYYWGRVDEASQIQIRGGGARNNRIEGNFLGLNAAGNSGTSPGQGISVEYATDNIIGGTSPQQRNIIAGNQSDGVELRFDTTARIQVIGNYIGLKQDGVSPKGNKDGVDVAEGVTDSWIGGTSAGARNIISGNVGDGIEISHWTSTQNNRVVGNYIGLGANGTQAVRNEQNGVSLEDDVRRNYIYQNVIVNNGANGVHFYSRTNENELYNNYIGVGPNGTTPMPNGTNPSASKGRSGVYIMGASQSNKIRNNIIANHPDHGVRITRDPSVYHNSTDTYFNTVSQNSIYNNTGAGIWLGSSGANEGIQPPVINQATTANVTGTAAGCANCTIELFVALATDGYDNSNGGEGKTYIKNGATNASGNFNISLTGGILTGDRITATVTDSRGNTSIFSRNVSVVEAPSSPTPTYTPTPTRIPTPVPAATRTPPRLIWLPILMR